MKKLFAMLALVTMLCFSAGLADAQAGVTANGTVALSYVVNPSISVSTNISTATFTGATPTTPAIQITTSWQLGSAFSNWNMAAYFTTATAALTDGAGDNVPVADMFSAGNGGTFFPCNSTLGAGQLTQLPGVPSGTVCYSDGGTITSADYTGSKMDSLQFQLQGLPTTLPAGTYTGTLNIEVGAK